MELHWEGSAPAPVFMKSHVIACMEVFVMLLTIFNYFIHIFSLPNKKGFLKEHLGNF